MRLAGAAVALAVIAVIASGCAPEVKLAPSSPPTPEAAAPTPTATPTPEPFVPDCLNILSPDTIATLESEGFVLIEEHEQNLRTESRVETMFFTNGGVDCMWGVVGGGDSLVAFGYSEIDPADAAIAQQRLAELGYVHTDEGPDAVLSISPEADVMGVGDIFLFTEGAWFHATTRDGLDEVRQHIG